LTPAFDPGKAIEFIKDDEMAENYRHPPPQNSPPASEDAVTSGKVEA
jgi:hypothetical protein